MNTLTSGLACARCSSCPSHLFANGNFQAHVSRWLHVTANMCLNSEIQQVFSSQNRELVKKQLEKLPPLKSIRAMHSSAKEAAVLVPMCHCNGKPSLLFTLRSSRLVNYKSQVSFPGGKYDATDPSLIHTAIREAEEEIGINPNLVNIDLWGQLHKLLTWDGAIVVHPVLAYIGSVEPDCLTYNKDEVDEVFVESIESLCDASRHRHTQFRSYGGYSLPVFHGTKHKIWGMTAVVTHHVLRLIAPKTYRTKKVKYIKPLLQS